MINYYWFNIDRAAFRIAKFLEKKASQKSLINIRASQWALDNVINDCKCAKSKCFVLEFGANIDSKDIIPNSVWDGGRLNILFSGVDWERKGGDIAVEIVRLLRKKGLDAHLLIVGIKDLPFQYKSVDYIDYWFFGDKNQLEEYKNTSKPINKVICSFFRLKQNVLVSYLVKLLASDYLVILLQQVER